MRLRGLYADGMEEMGEEIQLGRLCRGSELASWRESVGEEKGDLPAWR